MASTAFPTSGSFAPSLHDPRVRIYVHRPIAVTAPETKYQGKRRHEQLKRLFDVVGATLLLIVLSPVMLLVGILVRLTSAGAAIFAQERLTEGGRSFQLYKFRTMVADAEKLTGAVFAEENDPRVTSLGHFLRRTRLDELPQLINVIQGDMSLIGPRPERPELARILSERFPRFDQRLRVKAGLTGLAQVVQGYPDTMDGYRKKLALDMVYIRRQSFMLDLWICIKTIGVVVHGHGAR